MTMRVKLPNAFRFGFTGTPIDRTMQNTHRDFGPMKDGVQERYLSYYGIRRAIKDGATLEVHYIRDQVPFDVDEEQLNIGFEQMCEEMELEDEEAKDFVQRKKSQWKELATLPKRIDIVLDKMLKHFLEHPDPNGFKAQLVAVDRKACALYKDALDAKLKERGLPPEWSDVIISEAQNSEPDLRRFEYGKQKQDELIDYFKLTPVGVGAMEPRPASATTRAKWRPPLKILIVCDRLLTGFDAPVEQVMYLDKPLRDHNLLQAIARTNRPLPVMKKRTGVVVDYFGVFSEPGKGAQLRREHPRGVADRLGRPEGDGARRSGALHGALQGHHHRRHAGLPAGGASPPARSGCRQELRAQLQEPGAALGGGRARSLPLRAPLQLQLALRHLCRSPAAPARTAGHLWRTVGQDARADRREHDFHRDWRRRFRSSRSTRTTSPSSTSSRRRPTRPRLWRRS